MSLVNYYSSGYCETSLSSFGVETPTPFKTTHPGLVEYDHLADNYDHLESEPREYDHLKTQGEKCKHNFFIATYYYDETKQGYI